MAESFGGKKILITGGTGSFGDAVTGRLLRSDPEEIRIFSRDEWKQEQMRQRFADDRLRFYLGDVRDSASVSTAMNGVDLVFHAAALKQVPSCEFFPMQAVMTNVVGSDHVTRAAAENGVQRVVCLSTDKAAYPINAMGMTKALMEKVAQAAARTRECGDTVIATVRYGNVLYSRGSVVPLFVEQLRAGGPITITDPAMTRFLLPLGTAIDLVLFALEHAQPGDLFIRKAPASTIGDLATAVQKLFGTAVEQRTIGTRHGEKRFETLATREELARADDLGDYLRIVMDDRDLNYGKYFTEGNIEETLLDDYTSHNTERLQVDEAADILRDLPEVQAELRSVGVRA